MLFGLLNLVIYLIIFHNQKAFCLPSAFIWESFWFIGSIFIFLSKNIEKCFIKICKLRFKKNI